MSKILVVDDEPGIREFVTGALEIENHDVESAASAEEALGILDVRAFDLVMTDLKMPGLSGLELLQSIQREQPGTEVIVMTAHGTIETAVEAIKLGAFDYLQKPLGSIDELGVVVGRALERQQLRARVALAERTDSGEIRIGYGDPAMKQVEDAIRKVAATTASVLLLGESGSGKEVAARTIHDISPRRDGPFVALNCAALTHTLLESELFGHEKGAFTGATERRQGRIELAAGGTFFLDEIGELHIDMQAKLLRVLQEREFERVGGRQTIAADIRLIAATNRDLKEMIATGSFREDLYHRVAVFPIKLPPLRERPKDIVPLASLLLAEICRDFGMPAPAISDDALKSLEASTWPGNVRELRNCLERAVILSGGANITREHLVIDSAVAPTPGPVGVRPLAEVEREAITNALASVDGNRRRAAKLLGIGERTLYDKIKKYGVD